MSPSKVIARYGPTRGGVRVILTDDETAVIVKWRQQGERRQRSWPNTPSGRKEAKAWAEGFAEEMANGTRAAVVIPSGPLTLSALWDRYRTAEWDHLRPNTRRLYTEHWGYWIAFAGPDFPVDNVTLEMMDEFRKERLAKPLSVSYVNEMIRTVRRVYNWGDGRELVARNRVARYRVRTPKDQRKQSPPEYTSEEFRLILSVLDPTDAAQWRAWVALAICGAQGVRSHAALHLRWDDLKLETREVLWRAAWDKNGREWAQPLRQLTVRALRYARDHATADDYRGGWVLYPGSSKSRRKVYSAQSLWSAIYRAEKRAGVASLPGRGAHGLRRLLAGDIADATGNPVLAMQSIGDTDVRMASRYLKRRDGAIRQAFRAQDRKVAPPMASRSPESERQPTDNETVEEPS